MCMCTCTHTRSVVSDSLWPQGLKPISLLCTRDFPGKNTGMGYHFLLPPPHIYPYLYTICSISLENHPCQ